MVEFNVAGEITVVDVNLYQGGSLPLFKYSEMGF